MNLKEKFNKQSLRSHAGLWLMLVAILAMESIACVQYFYTRATIKANAVYRAQSELRSAEQEINTAAVELEAAAKMLAKMAEFCLYDPDLIPGCVNTLFETLESVEGAGIAFVPDYYPQKGHWYEVYATRNERTEKGLAIRQIGGADHDYTRSEWFNNGLTKDHAYWSNPYADNEGAHAVVVTCSYPVRDADNRVVGVVCIDISLSKLKFIFDYLQVYPDSYYSIYTASGKDIVTPDTIPGRKYLVFDEEIEATGWKLSIIIPEDILYIDLKRIGLIVNILMLLSLALLVFIMYRSTKNAYKMIEINNQKERMEGELEIAQAIQSAMLPKVFPPFVDRPDLNIYGVVHPAKEVGGDLYDFYVRHDKLFFCVGDVSGK